MTCLLCLGLHVQADLPARIPMRKGDLFGYCDPVRHWRIPPRFEDAHPFGKVGAVVQSGGKYGLIDTLGNWLLSPTLDEIQVCQGLILRKDAQYAIATAGGRCLSDFCYDAIYETKNGCFITDQAGAKGLLDAQGRVLVPNEYEYITQLRDNQGNWIDLLSVRSNGRYGLYNLCGERIHPCRFDRVDAFQEGFAIVQEGERFGLIDTEGHLRVPLHYDLLQGMRGGLCAAKLKNRWGFVDGNGLEVLPFLFEAVQENGFFQGRAAVNKAGTWVFVQRNGEVDFPLDHGYQSIGSLSEGLVAVCKLIDGGGVKYGYLTTDGRLKIPFRFDRAETFKRGFAIVGEEAAKDQSIIREMRYGVIDRNGRVVIPAVLHTQTQARLKRDSLGHLGFTTLVVNGRQCKVDAHGRRFDCREDALSALQATYLGTRCEHADLVAVARDGLWGFCDQRCKLVIPCQYAMVQCFANGLARVWPVSENGRLSYYIDESGSVYYEAQ